MVPPAQPGGGWVGFPERQQRVRRLVKIRPMLPRAAGVLLHPTSLPGPYGVADLCRAAGVFLDWAASAGFRLWRVLPLGPTGYGNSPYGSPSAFAGNPLL